MHLTGLKSGLSSSSKLFANDFYKKCLEHKLSPEDFDFAEDGTTHLKLAVLPKLVCKNLHASIIGNYDSSKPLLYTERIVGNVNACMGFIMDKKTQNTFPILSYRKTLETSRPALFRSLPPTVRA